MVKGILFDIDGRLVCLESERVGECRGEGVGVLREKGIKVLIGSGGGKRLMMDGVGEVDLEGYVRVKGGDWLRGNDEEM